MGQEIEIRPGIQAKDANGEPICRPIKSRIISLFAEQNDLNFAVPGGLIGIGTNVSALEAPNFPHESLALSRWCLLDTLLGW